MIRPVMQEAMMLPVVFAIASGLLLGLALYLVWPGRRGGGASQDLFRALGTDPASTLQRIAPAPVDLSLPIAGEVQWQAIRAHAGDAAYRRAVETVRLRYQLVGNPMLLPSTLRTTMARSGMTFREAMFRVAENDGLR